MPDQKSIFDDIEALRRDEAQLRQQIKSQSNTGRKKRARSDELFARIPYDRGFRLLGQISGAAWVVLIELDRQILMSKGQNLIEFNPEHLLSMQMTPTTIYRCLRQLEKAEVIKVDWCRGKRAVVTHLWFA